MSALGTGDATTSTRVHRIEIRPTPDAGDPRADTLIKRAAMMGVAIDRAASARIYLIEGELDDAHRDLIIESLLRNPVVEEAHLGARDPDGRLVEVHPLPGVMDPPAQSIERAIERLTGLAVRVSTAQRYDIHAPDEHAALDAARRILANPVVSALHTAPHHPGTLPRGAARPFNLTTVPIRDSDDDALERLSREGHLFLDLDEMRAIRDEYRGLGREPTDIELETLAQTWSEHCVHKTLKATIRYETDDPDDPALRAGRPGHEPNPDGSVTIRNLLKSTVAAATHELIAGGHGLDLSSSSTTPGSSRSTTTTPSASRSRPTTTPARSSPTAGRRRASAGASATSSARGWPPSRSRARTSSASPRPTSDRRAEGCLHPRGSSPKSSRACAITATAWASRRSTARSGSTSGTSATRSSTAGASGDARRDLISGEPGPDDRIIALGGRTGATGSTARPSRAPS